MDTIASLIRLERDKTVVRWALLAFVVWLSCTGPLRWFGASHLPSWLLGSSPNLFAGITLTFWQAFAVPARPLACAALALTVLIAVEAVQLFMPSHRADLWDIVASAAGSLVAAAMLYRRQRLSSGP